MSFGVHEVGGWVATADPAQGRGGCAPAREPHRDLKAVVFEAPHRLVHEVEGGLEVPTTPSSRSEGAEHRGAQACCGRTCARGIGDREPGAVAVLDEVE